MNLKLIRDIDIRINW